MASTIPNERTLRQITIATLLPAFPLLVAAGAMSDILGFGSSYDWYWTAHLTPTVIYFGLIPTFLSAITSVIALKVKNDPLAKRTSRVTALWALNDVFLALANLAILLPVWITEPSAMKSQASWMMLETYATVFLISNMCIHAYLGFFPVRSFIRWIFALKLQDECPHCHGKLVTHVETVGTKREGYSLLRAETYLDEEEGEPSAGTIRLSVDSEA